MTAEQLLTVYQELAELTSKMAAAAAAEDWDRVVELERDCASRVQKLKTNEGTANWSLPTRMQKAEIIRCILADDRRIRDLAMPWMAQLSALISNTRTQGRLLGAYGTV